MRYFVCLSGVSSCVAIPQDVTELSAVCDFGMS